MRFTTTSHHSEVCSCMNIASLEHVNITVSDPQSTAKLLCELFGWSVRWEGSAINDGYTVHVGTQEQYLAVYGRSDNPAEATDSYATSGSLNHVGVLVDDLDRVEQKVIAAGFRPYHHGNYEPGRRFYFRDRDRIEFEVISYAEVA